MTGLHKNMPVEEIHGPISYRYADQSEREADSGFVEADNLKLSFQEDDSSLWMLIDYAGPTWLQVGGSNAEDADRLILNVRKGSAGTINKGTPVYPSSYNPSGYIEVEAADANIAGKMPAIGLAEVNITNSATVHIVAAGQLGGLDTSAFAIGDRLYVSATEGELTSLRPAGVSGIQTLCSVLRSHVSSGEVLIGGAGRSNDVPNIPEGRLWLGDSNNHPQEVAFAHAATHVNATDDIQNAANTQKGLATAAHIVALEANTAHRGLTNNPHSVSKDAVGLGSVTNDAQLKRSANDISTFTEKTVIHDDDLFLIEDSEDSGDKKRVKKSSIGGSVAALNDVGDVAASSPEDGAKLVRNTSTNNWESVTEPRFRGYKTQAEMVAITTANDGDTVYCSTFDRCFWWDGDIWMTQDAVKMTNDSGVSLVTGDVVIVPASGSDLTADTTTSVDDIAVLGAVVLGGADQAIITIAVCGLWDVSITGAAVVGDFVATSATAKAAYSNTYNASGVFADVVEDKGSGIGLTKCWLHPKLKY